MHARTGPILALITLGGILSAVHGTDDPPFRVTPTEITDRLRQAKASQPMSWTQIPWTGTLLEARAASRREHCPVFLFSLDGNLASGRC